MKIMKQKNWKHLFNNVKTVIQSARGAAVRNINTLQVMTNYKIGQLIIEHEQGGETRADYGEKALKKLSSHLCIEFGRGFSLTNLKLMRQFYLIKKAQISRMASGQLPKIPKGQTASDQLAFAVSLKEPQENPSFVLSWSHYVLLMSIHDVPERNFYEIEASQQNWSLRELKRQYNSSLYERLALSRNKQKILELSQKGQIIESPSDIIKRPCVLDFLGFDERAEYNESDLESAIINKLNHFLLEMGKGFLFEARQKRFTFDSDHFYVDLVFYNRLLHCYVLIDLKMEKLTHQDLGQMQMYVNYFDRHVRQADEHPTIGIILCKNKNGALVELTLPKDANIYASEYKLYLPSKKELQKKLVQWTKEIQQ